MLNDPKATSTGASGQIKMDANGDNIYGHFGAQNVLRNNPNPPYIG